MVAALDTAMTTVGERGLRRFWTAACSDCVDERSDVLRICETVARSSATGVISAPPDRETPVEPH
jgi:hypothetical protein